MGRYKSAKLSVCGPVGHFITCSQMANWMLGDLSRFCVRDGTMRGHVEVRGSERQEGITLRVEKV